MVIPKINSAHGSETRNIINAAIDLINLHGKSIQDLVAEGQLTPTQYSQLLKEINGLIAKGDILESDFSEELRISLNDRINEKSTIKQLDAVDSKATEAQNKSTIAKDKADNVESQLGQILSNDGTSNNEVVASRVDATGVGKSSLSQRLTADYERLENNKVDKGDVRFNAVLVGDLPGLFVDFENSKVTTSPTGIGINKGASFYNLGAGEYSFADAGLTAYIAYDTELNKVIFASNSEANNLDKSRYGIFGVIRNYVNPKVFINGVGYSSTSDESNIEYLYNASIFSSQQYINIDTKRKKIVTTENLGGGASINVNGVLHHLKTGEYDYTVGTISKFVAFNIETRDIEFIQSSQIPNLDKAKYGVFGQLRSDVDHFDFRGTSYTVDGIVPSMKNLVSRTPEKSFYITGDTGKDFTPQSGFYNFDSTTNASEVYSFYDGLATNFSNYVTKENLTTTVGGNPINLYKFSTRAVREPGMDTQKKKKIFVVGGIHGHEDDSIFGLLRFLKELCEDWKSQDALALIRSNLELYVIPLLNPDGFNMRSENSVLARYNGNTVDLNRNFPNGWDESDDSMKGPSAASENETKAVMKVMNENPDFLTVIDIHNYVDFDEFVLWFGASEQKSQDFYKSFAWYMDSRLVRKRPDLYENHEHALIIILDTIIAGLASYADTLDLNGLLLEMPQNIKSESKEYVQEFNTDVIGNLIVSALRKSNHLE